MQRTILALALAKDSEPDLKGRTLHHADLFYADRTTKTSLPSHPSLTENLMRQPGDCLSLTHPYRAETETKVSPETADTFSLTLKAVANWPTANAPQHPVMRLRTALKRLLRNHALRCLECRPVEGSKETPMGKNK